VYTHVQEDPYGRAYRNILGLVRFAKKHPQPSPIMGKIIGGVNDAAGRGDDPHEIAMSRRFGDCNTTLWPSQDYWGQPGRSPPHALMMHVYLSEFVSWHDRASTVFWAGQHGSWGDVRRQYSDCADRFPHKFSYFYHDTAKQLPGQGVKQIARDNRKYMRHKVSIYLWGGGWSGGLFGQTVSGAALALPKSGSVHYQEVFEQEVMLRECRESIIFFDPDNVCSSLIKALDNETDATLRLKAARVHAVASSFLSESSVFDAMQNKLQAAGYKPHSWDVVNETAVIADGVPLLLKTCQNVLETLAHSEWDKWYDKECNLQPLNKQDVHYVAI